MTEEKKEAKKTLTLEETAVQMRKDFPDLPEDQITGSEAWKNRVQAEQAAHLLKGIKGSARMAKRKTSKSTK